MECPVRVRNERDRRALVWLRALVGDAAIAQAAQQCGGASKPYLSAVCRALSVTAPRFSATPAAPKRGRRAAAGHECLGERDW